LAFLKLLLSAANPSLAGGLLPGILDPTDELVTGQRCDVHPSVESCGIGAQRPTQVRRHLVHHATGRPIAGHTTTVPARPAEPPLMNASGNVGGDQSRVDLVGVGICRVPEQRQSGPQLDGFQHRVVTFETRVGGVGDVAADHPGRH
jgi:hypothetical protein